MSEILDLKVSIIEFGGGSVSLMRKKRERDESEGSCSIGEKEIRREKLSG